jgi:2-polyprenyl-6-hydroxyphenyl methylase/3-demethylubiquinone-9 3-methyltransferase
VVFGLLNRGNDLTIYSTHADEWWVPGAPRFRSLQNLTPFRLELIRAGCGDVRGKTIYDLGCGGGLLAVPLLEAGADVVGVDQSEASIKAAQRAARGRGRFMVGDARAVPLPDRSADIVLLADVIDHVRDYQRALREAARLLKPGGALFVGTLNRTVRAYLGAILLGEGLRLIPPGTHRFSMFVTPAELLAAGQAAGLSWQQTFGEELCIAATVRRWAITLRRGASVALAYSMVLRSPDDA